MGEVERKYHSQELHSSLRRTEQVRAPRRDLTLEDVAKVIEKDFKGTELFQDGQFIEMLKDRANEFGLPIELIVDAMRDLDKQVELHGETEALKEHAVLQSGVIDDMRLAKLSRNQRDWRNTLKHSADALMGIAITVWKEGARDIGLGLASDIREKKAETRRQTEYMKQAMESVLKRAIDKHQLETFLRTGGPGLRSIVERFQKGRIGLAEFRHDPELMAGIDAIINATDLDTLDGYPVTPASTWYSADIIDFHSYSSEQSDQIKAAIKGHWRFILRDQILTLATERSQAIVSSDDYEPNLPGVVGTGKSIIRRASLSGTLWSIGLRGGGKLAIGGALGAGVLTGGSGIAIAVGLGAITGAARAYINSEKQINRKRVDASIGTDTQQVEIGGGHMEDVAKAASLIEAQLSQAIQEATDKQQEMARAWATLQRQQQDAEQIAARGVPSPNVDDSDYTLTCAEMRRAMVSLYEILSDAHARLQRSRSVTKNRQDYISFGYHDRAQAISEFANKLEVGLSVVGTYVDNLGDVDKASMIQSMTVADIKNTELVNAIEEQFAEKLKEGRGKKIIKGAVRGGAVAGAVSFAMDVFFGGDANAPADVEPTQPTIETGNLLNLNDTLHAVILTNELMISPNDEASDLVPQYIPLPPDVDVTQVAFIPNVDGSQINIVDAATGESLHYINVSEQTIAPDDMVVDDPSYIVEQGDAYSGYLNPATPARFIVDGRIYVAQVEEESGIIEIFRQTTDGKIEKVFNTQSIYPEQVLDDPEKFPGLANLILEVNSEDPHSIDIYSAINGKIVAEFNIHEQLPEPPAADLPPAVVAPSADIPTADVPPVAAPIPDSPSAADLPPAPTPPADAAPVQPAVPVTGDATPPVAPTPPPAGDAGIPAAPAAPPAPGAEDSTGHGTGTPGKLEEPTKRDPFSSPSLEKPTDHGTPTTPKLEKPTGATGDGTTGMAPTEKPSGPQIIEQAFANADTKAALDSIGVKPDAVSADDSGFHVSVADNEYLSATEGWRQTRLELLMEAQRQGLINPGEKPLEILSRIEQATNLALNEKGAHVDNTAALQKAFGMDIKDIRGGVMKYVTGEKGAGVDSRWLTVVEQVAKLPKAVASADLSPASVAPTVDLGSATGQLDITPTQQAVGSSLLEYLPIASAHAEPLPGGMAYDNVRVTPLDLSTTLRPVGEQFIRAGLNSGGGISVGTIATSTLFEQVAPLQDKAAKVVPAPHPELNATTHLPEANEVEYGRVNMYEKPFADPVVAMYALEESRQLESITTDIGSLELAVSVAQLPQDVAPNGVTDRQRRTEGDVKTRYNTVFNAFARIRASSTIPDTTIIPGTQQTIAELERRLSNRIVVAGVKFGYSILRRSERFSKQLKKDVDEFGSRAAAYVADATIDPAVKLTELHRRRKVGNRFRDLKDLIDTDLRIINEDPAVVVKTDFDTVQSAARLAEFSLGDLETYLRDNISDLDQLVNPPTGSPIPVFAPPPAGPLPVAVSGPRPSGSLPPLSLPPLSIPPLSIPPLSIPPLSIPPSPPAGPSVLRVAPVLSDPFAGLDPDEYEMPVFRSTSDPSTLSNDPLGSDPGVHPNFGGWSDPDEEEPVPLTNLIGNDEDVLDLPAPLPDVGTSALEKATLDRLEPGDERVIVYNERVYGHPKEVPDKQREMHVEGLSSLTHARSDYGGEGSKYDEANEDSMLAGTSLDGDDYVLVIDGAGGSGNGLLASQIANKEAASILKQPKTDSKDARMNVALTQASRKIEQEANGGYTTAAGFALEREGDQMTAEIGWIGDAVVLIIRDGEILFASKSDNLVQRFIDNGKVQPSEYYNHRQNNFITKSLGKSSDEPNFTRIIVQEGDLLICGSDGALRDCVSDYEVTMLAQKFKNDPKGLQAAIFELAYKRSNTKFSGELLLEHDANTSVQLTKSGFGNGDNITVSVSQIRKRPIELVPAPLPDVGTSSAPVAGVFDVDTASTSDLDAVLRTVGDDPFEPVAPAGVERAPVVGGADRLDGLVPAPANAHPRFYEAVRAVIAGGLAADLLPYELGATLGINYARNSREILTIRRQLVDAGVIDRTGNLLLDRRAVLAAELQTTETTDAKIVEALRENVTRLRRELGNMLVVNRLATNEEIHAVARRIQEMNQIIGAARRLGGAVQTEAQRLSADVRGVEVANVRDWLFNQINDFERQHRNAVGNSARSLFDRTREAGRPAWTDTTTALVAVRDQLLSDNALSLTDATNRGQVYARLEGVRKVIEHSTGIFRRANQELISVIQQPELRAAIENIANGYTLIQAAAFYRRILTHLRLAGGDFQAAQLVAADGSVNAANLESLQLKMGSSEMQSDTYITDREQSYSSMEIYLGDIVASAVHDQCYRETMLTQGNFFDTITAKLRPLLEQFSKTPGGRAVLPDGRYSKVAKNGTQYHVLRAFELIPPDATPDTAELIPAKVDAFVKALLANNAVTPNPAIVADSMYKLTYGKEGALLTPDALVAVAAPDPVFPEPKPVGGPAAPPPEGPPAGDPALEQGKLLDKAIYLVETMYTMPMRVALNTAMESAGMDTTRRIEVCNFALAEGRKASLNLVGNDKLSGRRLAYALGIRNIDDIVDARRIDEAVAEIIKLQPPFEEDQQMVMDESTARLNDEVARVLGNEFGEQFATAITNQIPKGTTTRVQEVNRLTALGNFAFRWSELRRNKQAQVGTVMALTGNELLAAFGWHNGVDTPNIAAVRATAQRALDGLTPVFDSARFAVTAPENPPAAPISDRPVGDRSGEPAAETPEMIAQREYDAMVKELSGDEGGFAKLKTARENAVSNELKDVASQTPTEHDAARQVGFAWKRALADLESRVKHYQGMATEIKTVQVGEGSKKTIKTEAEKHWKQLHKKESGELALMNSAIEAWSKARINQFGNELQADLTAKDVPVVDRIALVASSDGKFRKLYAQLDEDFNLLNRYPRSDAAVLDARAAELKTHADYAEANVKIADRWGGQMRAVETAFGDDIGRVFLVTFASEIAAGSPAEQFKIYGRLLDRKVRSQTSEVALKGMNLLDAAGAVNAEGVGEFIGEAIRQPTEDEETVERLGRAVFARFGVYMTDRLRETVGALPVARQRELLERLVGAVEVSFEAARTAHRTMLQGAPHNLRGRDLDDAMRSRQSADVIRQATLEPLLLAVSSGGSAEGNMGIVVDRLVADVPVEGLFAGLIDQEAAVREIGARLDTVRARLGTSMTESVDTALRPLELPRQLELLDALLNSVRENFEGLVTANAGSVDKARHAILRQLHLVTEVGTLIPENIAEVTTRLLAGTTGEALFANLQTERAPDPAQVERNINRRLRIVEARLGVNMRDGLAQDLNDVEPVRALALINVLLDSTRERFDTLVTEQSGNERAARAVLLRELHLATDRDVLIPDNMQEVSNRLQADVVGPALYAGLVAEVRVDPIKLEQNRNRRLGIVEERFGPRMRNGLGRALTAEPMERQVALLNTLLNSTRERFDALVEANEGNPRTARDLLMTELHMATDRGNPISENLQTVAERLLAGTTGMELYAGLTAEAAGPPATEEERDNRLRSVDARLGRRMVDVVVERIAGEPIARQVELVGVLRDSVRERFTQLFDENGKAASPARAVLTRELHLVNERNQLIEPNIHEVVTRLLAGRTGAELYNGLSTEVRRDAAELQEELRRRFSAVVYRFGGRMRDIMQDRTNGIAGQPLERQITLTENLLDAVKDRFNVLLREQAGDAKASPEQAKAARDLLMRELQLTNLNDKPINENILVVMERLLGGVTGTDLFADLTVGGRGPRGGNDQGGPANGPTGDPTRGPESGRGPERGRDTTGDRSRTGRGDTDRYDPDAYKRIGATVDYMMADMQRTPAYGYLVTERIADQGVLNTLHNEVNLGGRLFHEALRPFHEALVTFAETGPALIARFHLDTLPNLRTLGTAMRTPNVTADRLRMILLSFERTSSGDPTSNPDGGAPGGNGTAGGDDPETRTSAVDPIRNLVTAPADAHPRFFEAVRGVLGESYVSESSVRAALGLGYDRADIETAQRVLRQLQTANVVDARGRVVLDRKAVLAGDLGAKETTDSAIIEALNIRVAALRADVTGKIDNTHRANPAIVTVINRGLENISTYISRAMNIDGAPRDAARRLLAGIQEVEVLAVRDWIFAQADLFERDYNGVMRDPGRPLTDRVEMAGRPHWVESIEAFKRVRDIITSNKPLSLDNLDDRSGLAHRLQGLEAVAKNTSDSYTFQRGQLRRAIGDNKVLEEAIGEVVTPLSPMQAAAYYRRLVTHTETRGIDALLDGDKKPEVKTLRSLSFENDAVAKASDVNILQRDGRGGLVYSYIGGPVFGAVNERIYLDTIGEQTKLFSTLMEHIFPMYSRFADIPAVKALKKEPRKELVYFHMLRALELVPTNVSQTLEPVPARVDKLVENLRAGRVEINTAVVEDSVFTLSNGKEGKALAAASPEPPPGDDPDGADTSGKAEAIDRRNVTIEASGLEIPNLVALEDTEDATQRALALVGIYNDNVRIGGDRFPAVIEESENSIRGLLRAVREAIEPVLQIQLDQTVGRHHDRLHDAMDEVASLVARLRNEQDEFAASLRRKAGALDEYNSRMYETTDQMRRAASILEEASEYRARLITVLAQHLEEVQHFLAQPGTVETAQPASPVRPESPRVAAPAAVEVAAATPLVGPIGPRAVDLPPAPSTGEPSVVPVTSNATEAAPVRVGEVTMLSRYLPELAHFDSGTQELSLEDGSVIDMRIADDFVCQVTHTEGERQYVVNFRYDDQHWLEINIQKRKKSNGSLIIDARLHVAKRERKVMNAGGNTPPVIDIILEFTNEVQADYRAAHPEARAAAEDNYDETTDNEAMEQNRPVRMQRFQDLFGKPSRKKLEDMLIALEGRGRSRDVMNATLLVIMENVDRDLTTAGGVEVLKTQTARRTALEFGPGNVISDDKLVEIVRTALNEFETEDESDSNEANTSDNDADTNDKETGSSINPERLETMKFEVLEAIEPVRTLLASNMESNGTAYAESVATLSGILEHTPKFPFQNNFITRLGGLARNMEAIQQVYRDSIAVTLQRLDSDIPERGIDANVMSDISSVASQVSALQERAAAEFEKTSTLAVDMMTKLGEYETRYKAATEGQAIKGAVGSMIAPMKKIREVLNVAALDMTSAFNLAQSFQDEISEVNVV